MTVFVVGSSMGTMPKFSATKVIPMNRIPSRIATAVSVVAAFFASGGLNAGTPLAMASVPVSATDPDAKARRISSTPSGSSGFGAPGRGDGGLACSPSTTARYIPIAIMSSAEPTNR